MILKRSVRVVKKIQVEGVWKFVSLERQGTRYVWDSRPGAYFLDWHEAGRRRREFAGHTPAQVLQAQKRKQAEIAGALVLNGHGTRTPMAEPPSSEPAAPQKPEIRTAIGGAIRQFLLCVAAHSPDKPETVRRYRKVLEHFERHLGHKRFLEAITDYHSFWLASRRDGLYNAAGKPAVAAPKGGAADTKIGDEVDVTFTVPLTPVITLGVGLGHLFTGPFLETNSPGHGNTFSFVFLTYRF